MKHVIKINRWAIILLINILLIGCSAEDGIDGAIGPQGPQGEQGLQGEQGPQGEQGEQGEQGPIGPTGPVGQDGQNGQDGQDGNANVIASDWIPSDFSENTVTFTFFTVEDEVFTQEILDSGTVLAYARDGVSTVPIPVVFDNKSYYFIIPDALGEIRFIGRSVDGSPQSFGVFTDFRYVIIPSNNTRSATAQTIDYKNMTYYQVMDHFGLKY